MSDGTKRVKVIENKRINDVIVRTWKQRLFNLPWKPFKKYVVNNNAYYDKDNNSYHVAPNTFKKLSGKTLGPNVKFVSMEALRAVCG